MTVRVLLKGMVGLTACFVAAGVLVSCGVLPSAVQPPPKVPLVGLLAGTFRPASMENYPFAVGLRELGYVDGQNIRVEYRFANNETDRLDELASELLALKVDVLVADGEEVANLFRRATSTIPVVFTLSADPVGAGLVSSIAHPGGNLTGLSTGTEQAITKSLEFAGQLVPGVSQLGVLWSPDFRVMATQLRSLEATAPTVGIRLQAIEIRRPEDFEGAFQAAANAQLPALVVTGSSLTGSVLATPQLADLAIKYHLPTLGALGSGGVLIGYGANRDDLRRHAARYVDRILKGAKPADLPVEAPTTFDLVVNLKLAQAMGITVPPVLLSQATEVIR